MPKDIFIVDKEYTFQESIYILARAISSIVDKNDETIKWLSGNFMGDQESPRFAGCA